jgi:hypothetical protein
MALRASVAAPFMLAAACIGAVALADRLPSPELGVAVALVAPFVPFVGLVGLVMLGAWGRLGFTLAAALGIFFATAVGTQALLVAYDVPRPNEQLGAARVAQIAAVALVPAIWVVASTAWHLRRHPPNG